MSPRWVVHKFGGTSLADADRYRGIVPLLAAEPGARQAVVVSAMSGVTDGLLRLVELAAAGSAWEPQLDQLAQREQQVTRALLLEPAASELCARIAADVRDLAELAGALRLMRSRPRSVVDLVLGYGELWSAQRLAAHLAAQGAATSWLDARQVLIVRPGDRAAVVDWDASRTRLDDWLARNDRPCVVITGFVASTADGTPTTLGRNGSDFSASIFAALLEAVSITIWTDVDGVMSADPRRVADARVLPELSYDEAMELAYFGAKVIHPSTMSPAVRAGIPIFIRNTFRPQCAGTRIHRDPTARDPVKGFATVENLALVNLEGSGMIGVPGIAERLFGALSDAFVSVILISQASSEHSICFAVPNEQADTALAAVERAFFAERHTGQIQPAQLQRDCAVLAAVGDGMAGHPGLAGQFFGALGRASVNVRAIAQGSSERNISAVIDGHDVTRSLRAVHAGFYLSNQTLSIGLIGPGLVGATLLDQFSQQIDRLRAEAHVDLRIRGILNRSQMVLDDHGVPLDRWRDALAVPTDAASLARFVDHVQTESIPHAVLIDCTADEGVAQCYADWFARGIHVITANKKANTADLAYYRLLRERSRSLRRHYLYETTVGAGLPVIQTLRDLVQTGDEVRRIEGSLSGTLAFLFHGLDSGRAFSDLVREARRLGYTEPDPREDLSGMDVARKLVILAREIGLETELASVAVEGLVPRRSGESVEDCLSRLRGQDEGMRELGSAARARGEVLRFVGVVDPTEGLSVRLRSYPVAHAIASGQGTDNVVQFRTRRYDRSPLVIRGPGAGPDVTAGGLFADLLRLALYLGAAL